MPQFTTSYKRQLSDVNDDGTNLGDSPTDKISFYGVATPIVQQVLATGVTHTADDIIAFLQLIGLVRQS